jgi:hypothetical protein
MGLKTVVSFSRDTRAKSLEQREALEPFAEWKEARRQVFAQRRIVYYFLVFAFILLLARAVRGQEDWTAAVLSIGMIPVATELTCYYYSILLGYAFLLRRSPWSVAMLCAYSVLSWICASMWVWNDEQFTWLSLITIVFIGVVTWRMGLHKSSCSSDSANGFT